MADLNERDSSLRPEQPSIAIDDAFMRFRLPGSRASLNTGHIPSLWISHGDALRVEAGPWSVTAQAVYVAPHCLHVVDGRGQLFQGVSLRGFRWPADVEPRPVMALSPRALNLFVDHLQRQDGSIAHELAALLGRARLVVGVDTGLVHLATALDTPTIALYIATDPALTGVHGPGFARNLGGVGQSPTVAQVLNVARQAPVQ